MNIRHGTVVTRFYNTYVIPTYVLSTYNILRLAYIIILYKYQKHFLNMTRAY